MFKCPGCTRVFPHHFMMLKHLRRRHPQSVLQNYVVAFMAPWSDVPDGAFAALCEEYGVDMATDFPTPAEPTHAD